MADNTKKDDEPENPNANPMAAFGPHLDDIAEALDILYIPKNPSGRLKFREKWDFLADYIFDDELVDYDINGVKDHDRRKILEEQANERRLKLKATLQEIVAKSVKSAQLQFDYVGQIIDDYGATLSQHLYAGDVVERVRPGLLKKEKDVAEEKAEKDSEDQKLSVDEAAILQNKEASEQFDESDYNDVKPIVTDAPATGKPGKMRDSLDDMVSDFKSDSLKASTDGTAPENSEESTSESEEQSANDQPAKAAQDDMDDLEDVSTNQVDDGFDDLKSGDGALEDPKTELLDIMDVVEKQDDLADVSDVGNILPETDDASQTTDDEQPALDATAPIVDEKPDLPEPKKDALHSAAQVEDKPQEAIAQKIETPSEPSVASAADGEKSQDDADKQEDNNADTKAENDSVETEAPTEPDDRGVFVGRGSASQDAADDEVNEDFWAETTQEQPSPPAAPPKVEEKVAPAPDEKSPAAVEVEPPKADVPVPPPVSDAVPPPVADTIPPALAPDVEADVKPTPEPAAMPDADVKVDDKPEAKAEAKEEAPKPEAVITEDVPKVDAAPAPDAAKAPDVAQDAKEPAVEEPKVAEPPATPAEENGGEAKPSVFGSPTLAGEKKQEPYSGMFNRLASVISEESLGVEI